MPPKIPPADPLTGSETAIVIQGGKPVRTSTQAIADKAVAAAPPPVRSVAGKTGDVVLAKADVGLGSAENTADIDKPVSTAQKAAITAGRLRVARFSGTTNSSGVASIIFDPPFSSVPDVDVVDAWSGEQMVTGSSVPGSVTKSGCQVQVMLSRATLLLSTGPFQKASAGVAVVVRAIGN